MNLSDLYSAFEPSSKFEKAINNGSNHELPVKQIFENYDNILLWKTDYGNMATFLIPSKKLVPFRNPEYGIIEISFSDNAERKHTYFKTIKIRHNLEQFLQRNYDYAGDDIGEGFAEALKTLQTNREEGIALKNSKDERFVFLYN